MKNKINKIIYCLTLIIGLFILSSKQVKAVYDDSLLLYWDFNNTNVDKISNISGNNFGYNGSNPWNFSDNWSLNVAQSWNNVNVTGLNISQGNNFSISFWQYYNNNADCFEVKNTNNQMIVYLCADHVNDGRWPVKPQVYSNAYINESPTWNSNLIANPSGNYSFPNYAAGWHLITLTFTANHQVLYVDGVRKWDADLSVTQNYGNIGAIYFYPNNWAGNTYIYDDFAVWDKTLSDTEVAQIYVHAGGLNNLTFTPAEYCGDTLCQTISENCSTCPSDCGECANNPNSGDSINLFFFSNPYTFSNQSTAIVRYLYNENIFTPYDYIEIREISPDWTTSTFIATSTIIDSTGFFTNKSNGSSYFTLTGNASTTGYVQYDVIGHLAAYWSPTLGDVEATTTIPYVVTVNWQSTQIPTVADILAASSSNPFYDDDVMYDAACNEDDWNTPPPEIFGIDVPALNLTVIGCKFKLGFIIAGNKFTTLATDGIYKAGNILKNVFPFNIYTNLNDSWKASANATVITELSFLSPIDGNLTAQIPTTGTSTATIILWGKDIFTSSSTLGTVNAQKTNQLFLAIKTIIKWALWGLFGLWAIKNGKAFIEKMTGGQ